LIRVAIHRRLLVFGLVLRMRAPFNTCRFHDHHDLTIVQGIAMALFFIPSGR
jgi:hypothetical protein